MDVYYGFIAALPYKFVPSGWARCNGAEIAVSQNQALFSLLGTTFGGDGVKTFNLPDLRGRTIVGATVSNAGPGLSLYPQGQAGGYEQITLGIPQIPAHTHVAQINSANLPVTGSISASLNVNTATDGSVAPSNAFLAKGTGSGDSIYANSADGTLNSGSITVNSNLSVNASGLSVQVGATGQSMPHENRMPYLAIQYCIAITGLYPSPQ